MKAAVIKAAKNLKKGMLGSEEYTKYLLSIPEVKFKEQSPKKLEIHED